MEFSEAQQKVIDYLKDGCVIYYNIQGSDPVYKNGILIDRIKSIGTISHLISVGKIKEDNYQYHLITAP